MSAKVLFYLKMSELKVSVNSCLLRQKNSITVLLMKRCILKTVQVKTSTDYRWLKHYNVLKMHDTSKLILLMCKSGDKYMKYLYNF